MKTSATKILVAQLALAVALAGCVSKSYDKGAATSLALRTTADAVAGTSTSVNDVLAALNNLTFKSQGDLRDQYDAFVSVSKDLTASIGKLDLKATGLQVTAAAFISDWTNKTASIQNPELRNRSAERKAEVSGQLSDVTASYQGVKNSLKPFTSDLHDIQTYLGTDLTAGGLDAIRDVVAKTKVDAVPLRDSIKKLQASFDTLSTALSPVLPGK
jgi:hypothetical protein